MKETLILQRKDEKEIIDKAEKVINSFLLATDSSIIWDKELFSFLNEGDRSLDLRVVKLPLPEGFHESNGLYLIDQGCANLDRYGNQIRKEDFLSYLFMNSEEFSNFEINLNKELDFYKEHKYIGGFFGAGISRDRHIADRSNFGVPIDMSLLSDTEMFPPFEYHYKTPLQLACKYDVIKKRYNGHIGGEINPTKPYLCAFDGYGGEHYALKFWTDKKFSAMAVTRLINLARARAFGN